MGNEFQVGDHMLVPKHTKLSDKEKQELFDKHKVTFVGLPKILKSDKAIAHIDVTEGDVIKIERNSETAGKSIFYRGVIND